MRCGADQPERESASDRNTASKALLSVRLSVCVGLGQARRLCAGEVRSRVSARVVVFVSEVTGVCVSTVVWCGAKRSENCHVLLDIPMSTPPHHCALGPGVR